MPLFDHFRSPLNVQFAIECDLVDSDVSDLPPPPAWVPPPNQTVAFGTIRDTAEVLVYSYERGPLVGVIKVVVPPGPFVFKCAAYIQRGLGLLVVDVVTRPQARAIHELLLPWVPGSFKWSHMVRDSDLYAISFRPVERHEQSCLDMWHADLAIGKPLPSIPLWLPGNVCLQVDLETAYARACHELRISADVASGPWTAK